MTTCITRLRIALLPPALAAGLAVLAPPARAQGIVLPGPSSRGALLIHGNYCGPGNRGPGYPPIDALDRACARHDACAPTFGAGLGPRCACNRRLRVEAGRVARDRRAPAATRRTAWIIADFAGLLPCR